MPSHVHLVVSTKEGGKPLPGIIRDFKKHTSKEIVKAVKALPESRREWLLRAFGNAGKHNPNNTNYQVWQQDRQPVELVTMKFTRQKIDYVHANPVAARIVFNAADYVYSSATAYVGRAAEYQLEIVPLEVHGVGWNE